MSVTELIAFEVRPGARTCFLSLLDGVLDAMRAEASFVDATLHRDPADENRFLLHETWADHREVMEVQVHRPYREAWHAALPEILARPRDVSVREIVRADRAPPG